MILIRYDDKLWTDNLYYPGSPRQQALSRHIQEAVNGITLNTIYKISAYKLPIASVNNCM